MSGFLNSMTDGWNNLKNNVPDWFTNWDINWAHVAVYLLAILVLLTLIWFLIRLQFHLMGKPNQVKVTTTPAAVNLTLAKPSPTVVAPVITKEIGASKIRYGLNSIPLVQNNGLEMTLIEPILQQGWEPFCVDQGVMYFRMQITTVPVNLPTTVTKS